MIDLTATKYEHLRHAILAITLVPGPQGNFVAYVIKDRYGADVRIMSPVEAAKLLLVRAGMPAHAESLKG